MSTLLRPRTSEPASSGDVLSSAGESFDSVAPPLNGGIEVRGIGYSKSIDATIVQADLEKYLTKVRRIFDVDSLIRESDGVEAVIKYYNESDIGYRLFHSSDGSIHMALNYDGVFDKAGYYEQARIVQGQIDELRPTRVLELASGKGFNLLFLAERNPGIDFAGVDITPHHVREAASQARALSNVRFHVADFQVLPFPSGSFEAVFIVESLCHATDMAQVLSEIYRVLAPGGRFIVIDGFRKPEFSKLGEDVRTAARLVEVAMAVYRPFGIYDWLQLVRRTGFRVLSLTDASQAIVPNLLRLQFIARGYFKFPILSNLILRILPAGLVRNAIAGLLMPLTVRAGAQGYYIAVLERS